MEIRGNGPPHVLVPGMQGRWEWMTPTVEALAGRFRVGTYSLCGEPGAPPLEPSYAGDLARLDVARAPMSAPRAATRVHLVLADDVAAVAPRVTAPTLLVTGDDGLDRLVPPENTRQYRRYLPRTTVARLEGTGHMGTVTRASTFAALVGKFVGAHG